MEKKKDFWSQYLYYKYHKLPSGAEMAEKSLERLKKRILNKE